MHPYQVEVLSYNWIHPYQVEVLPYNWIHPYQVDVLPYNWIHPYQASSTIQLNPPLPSLFYNTTESTLSKSLLQYNWIHPYQVSSTIQVNPPLPPRRTAGDVWYLPTVWSLRAVIWFHFTISSLVLCLILLLFLSVVFLPAGPSSWTFSKKFFNIFH